MENDPGSIRSVLDNTVPDLMQRFNVPGVALVLVDIKGTRLAANYGYTDNTRQARVTASTVFEGASLGKPLFAYAFLMERTLGLDDRVANYLERPLTADRTGAAVTPRQLLSHSSGLVFSETEQRRVIEFPPGSRWHYSGPGYLVLQQAMENMTGETLDNIIRARVTGPLEMSNTGYLPPGGKNQVQATGHDRRGRPLAATAWRNASAASSLHTTAKDYGLFLSAMLAGLRPGAGSTIPAQMLQPEIAVDESLSLYWGLGWAVAYDNGDTLFLHWGSNPGFKSLALGSVEKGIALVVLTNGDNGLELATSLVSLVFGEHYPFLEFFMLHPDD